MTSVVSARRDILFAVICSVLIILLTGGGAVFVISDEAFRSAAILNQAAETMYSRYPDAINWNHAVDKGLNAIFDELDPYSGLIESHAYHEMEEELSGGYGGLGIAVYSLHEGLFLHAVTEGSPADKSGLRIGDYILRADSIDFTDTTRFFSSSHLRGEEGSKMTLTIFRPATLDTFKVDITRGRVEFSSVPYAGMTSDSLLYIRISDFEAGVSDDVMAAVDKFLMDDSILPHGIILDMRDNPGGLLSEAIATADIFLDNDALIVGTLGRSVWESREYRAEDEDFSRGLPIAVLVNDQTASAAEIVSGALKFNGRAILVGDTTFGKGLVQGHINMPDGEGLRLTISRYYLEGGRFLNDFDSTLSEVGHGLVPDTVITFQDYDPFISSLERDLLFHRFASNYAEQLDSVRGNPSVIDNWCNQFAGYCYDKGFFYRSEATDWAEVLAIAAQADEVSTTTMEAVQKITGLVHRGDSLLFSRNKEYIFHRLTWLSVETIRNEAAGYEEVEVPHGKALSETRSILAKRIRNPKDTLYP